MAEDFSWMNNPPSIENTEDALKAMKILKRPTGVPYGHTNVSRVNSEEYSPAPKQLDPEKSWIFPGLLYCMIGLDRSIFDLFSIEYNVTINISTHLSTKPVYLYNDRCIQSNKWFYTVQGIDSKYESYFRAFCETFKFRNALANITTIWGVTTLNHRIVDPFASTSLEKKGANITVILPINFTEHWRVSCKISDSLLLGDAVFYDIRSED